MKKAFPVLLFFWGGTSVRIYAQDTEQKKLIVSAIGDSITTGFNARNFGDNKDLNWGSGVSSELNSHLKRLEKEGFSVTGFNNAVAGSKAADLPQQIDAAINNAADYITMTIGANDLCSWPANHRTKLNEFKTKMISEMTRIIESRPKVKIAMSPIPNLYNLWEVASTDSQCQSRWDFFNICAPLLNSKRTPEERQKFMGRWQDANQALEEIAGQFPDHILFPKDAGTTVFEMKHISELDCFHPSIAGQDLLAAATWLSPVWEP